MENVKRRALGRGLGALIPGAYDAGGSDTSLTVSISSVQPNTLQPRQRFSDSSIGELADSIREKGILQPLLVRRTRDGFELIAGERRWRAAQRLGLDQIPVIVHDASDSESLEMALIENIQREDLNPLEEARAYRRLTDEFHHTHDDIAKRVGKDRSTIANTVRLLQLPEEIQANIEAGLLSAGHARALLTVGVQTAKVKLAREIVARKLSVREAERLAKHHARPLADADQRAVEQRLTEALGTRVRLLARRNGAGKIEIEYYSLDGLNGLIDRLSNARQP